MYSFFKKLFWQRLKALSNSAKATNKTFLQIMWFLQHSSHFQSMQRKIGFWHSGSTHTCLIGFLELHSCSFHSRVHLLQRDQNGSSEKSLRKLDSMIMELSSSFIKFYTFLIFHQEFIILFLQVFVIFTYYSYYINLCQLSLLINHKFSNKLLLGEKQLMNLVIRYFALTTFKISSQHCTSHLTWLSQIVVIKHGKLCEQSMALHSDITLSETRPTLGMPIDSIVHVGAREFYSFSFVVQYNDTGSVLGIYDAFSRAIPSWASISNDSLTKLCSNYCEGMCSSVTQFMKFLHTETMFTCTIDQLTFVWIFELGTEIDIILMIELPFLLVRDRQILIRKIELILNGRRSVDKELVQMSLKKRRINEWLFVGFISWVLGSFDEISKYFLFYFYCLSCQQR